MRRLLLIACFVFPSSGLFAQSAAPTPPAVQTTPPTLPPPTIVGPRTPAPPQGGQGGRGQAPPAIVGAQTTPPPGRGPTPVPTIPAPGQNVPGGSWRNLKLDVTILDSITTDSQSKKTVSMLLADGKGGSIRSASTEGLINIDARPQIHVDGRIMLQITIEYRPELTPEQAQKSGSSRVTMYTESLTMVVLDGRPTVISQSADPRSDRKVAVEVLATIQK